MRVLHSTDVYLPISQNWIYPQITQVPGTDTRVLCSATTNQADFPMADTRILNTNSLWTGKYGTARLANTLMRRLGMARQIADRWVLNWHPQLIHSHFGTRGWQDLALKRKTGAPLVTSFYGVDAWSLPKSAPVWLERFEMLFSEVDMCLVEGPAMRQRLIDIGCPPAKIRVVRIGVNLSKLPFRQSSFANRLRIVMLGRFVEKKGLVDGLRACLKARRGGVNLQVSIIGDAASSDRKGQAIKQELLDLAHQPELAGCVDFHGLVSQQQARALLRLQDVFLSPSKHSRDGDAEGGSPVALTEAMALGLVCIGTRHCDIPEVVIDGSTGYLCDEGDVIGLTNALQAVSNNRECAYEISKAGRQHIVQSFGLEAQMLDLANAYHCVAPPSARSV